MDLGVADETGQQVPGDGGSGAPDAGEVPRPGGRRITAAAWDARVRAEDVVRRAEEEARALREGAEAEVAGARAQGLEAGREEGRALAAAEVVRAGEEADRILSGLTPGLLDVAASLAGRILEREVQPGVEVVALAARALESLRGHPRVTLRASPLDVPALEEDRRRPGSSISSVRIVPDPSLDPGEVVTESGGARVDGRFPALLAELRRALEEEAG